MVAAADELAIAALVRIVAITLVDIFDVFYFMQLPCHPSTIAAFVLPARPCTPADSGFLLPTQRLKLANPCTSAILTKDAVMILADTASCHPGT